MLNAGQGETEPLLPPRDLVYDGTMQVESLKTTYRRCRERCGEILESHLFHKCLIGLISIDAVIVLIDLGYTLLSPDCRVPDDHHGHEAPVWIEVLSKISLVLTSIFLAEIPIAIWAFGFQYYNPFGRVRFSALHFFDAVIVIGTFVLEVILTGKEREFVGLLVILRLWRIVKLAGGLVVGMGELDADTALDLAKTKRELEDTRAQLATAREEALALKQRLYEIDPESAVG